MSILNWLPPPFGPAGQKQSGGGMGDGTDSSGASTNVYDNPFARLLQLMIPKMRGYGYGAGPGTRPSTPTGFETVDNPSGFGYGNQ